MTAGPIIIRTAFRSLVARDIRSPVRCAWKYAERQLLQLREEVVAHVVLDVARRADDDPAHQEQEQRADAARRRAAAAAYVTSFCRGDAAVEIVDRVLQDPRRQQLEGGREDDADQPEQEPAPVAENVREKASNRGPHLTCEYSSDIWDRASHLPRRLTAVLFSGSLSQQAA